MSKTPFIKAFVVENGETLWGPFETKDAAESMVNYIGQVMINKTATIRPTAIPKTVSGIPMMQEDFIVGS